MNRLTSLVAILMPAALLAQTAAPANPLWHEQKTKNYLPHMTWVEVEDLLKRSDMVIIPIAALEQHALHLPIGTDFLNGVERAKLVAQSLMKHGFRRFLLLNSHGGNQIITRYIADRINQETEGIAVELGDAAAPFITRTTRQPDTDRVFDRHAGVGETATSLYMFPTLVNMAAARRATLTMPDHLQKMLPEVVAGDPTATMVFLAEGLKAKETGKHTSTREMSDTGTWGLRDPKEATAEAGRRQTEAFVEGAVKFIEKWKQLRPLKP
jgi:creatinine amidohydrolase